VVGNANHVHALTVQYYEVPQIYRTSVGLHRIEPCLFVTIKPIDFLATAATGAVASGDIVVRHCRNALLGAALDQQTRSLLDAQAPESTTVEIRPTVQRRGSSAGVGRLRELRHCRPRPPPACGPAAVRAVERIGFSGGLRRSTVVTGPIVPD
jgi:hypothetical protein